MTTSNTAQHSAASQHKTLGHKKATMAFSEPASKQQPTNRTLKHDEALADVEKVRAKTMQMKGLTLKYTSEYNSHRNLKTRCKDQGIALAPEFERFPDFLAVVGPVSQSGDTIDRIDPKGAYSPDNVRWANKTVQARNRTNVRHLTHGGKTLPLVEWAEQLGVPASRLRSRLQNGWSDSEIITSKRLNKSASIDPPSKAPASEYARYLPWPEQDIEEWETAYQRSSRYTSRIEYALETSKSAFAAIQSKSESLFPDADAPRSEEMQALEARLTARYSFFQRAYCRAKAICDHGRADFYTSIPDRIKTQLRHLYH